MSTEQGEANNRPQDVKPVGFFRRINTWIKNNKETADVLVSSVGVFVALVGVIGALVALCFLISQTNSLRKQTDLLGNQTSYLSEQLQLQQSDYVKRTRPYLRLIGMTVSEGNSSEVLDVLLELQNFGQVPATKVWLGEREGGEIGVYIGAEDLKYNESTGEFTATYKGPCMPSLSPDIPGSIPAEKPHGTSADITITATPCWLASLNQTGAPEDQIFYPNISGNQTIPVEKSAFDEATRVFDTMQIGLKYYGEGRGYYYIATLKKAADNTWVVQPIERGN